MPSHRAVKFAYAPGSRSGATGETIFNFAVTNRVDGDTFSEGFIDPATLPPGNYRQHHSKRPPHNPHPPVSKCPNAKARVSSPSVSVARP